MNIKGIVTLVYACDFSEVVWQQLPTIEDVNLDVFWFDEYQPLKRVVKLVDSYFGLHVNLKSCSPK